MYVPLNGAIIDFTNSYDQQIGNAFFPPIIFKTFHSTNYRKYLLMALMIEIDRHLMETAWDRIFFCTIFFFSLEFSDFQCKVWVEKKKKCDFIGPFLVVGIEFLFSNRCIWLWPRVNVSLHWHFHVNYSKCWKLLFFFFWLNELNEQFSSLVSLFKFD